MVGELCHGDYDDESTEKSVTTTATAKLRRSQSLPIHNGTDMASPTNGSFMDSLPHSKSEERYVDRYGFVTEQKMVDEEIDPKRNRRVQKWDIMMENWDNISVHRNKLIRRRLRKGLPDSETRRKVWPMLMKLEKPPKAMYASLWGNTHADMHVQEIIERDIHRTFPKHSMLSRSDGQASLRRLLRAYSEYDKEIGYCQGMNFIAAMFLTILPEEQAFWMLVATMYEPPCSMRGLFAEGMRATHKVLYVADKLIHQFIPRTAKHLDAETIHVTMYATQWLLTVYTSSFPFDLVTRVWDCFLFEGWKVVYRVMLALLQTIDLTKLRFEEILGTFREMSRKDLSGIMEAAHKIPLKRRHIEKYEKEWKQLSSDQQLQQGSP